MKKIFSTILFMFIATSIFAIDFEKVDNLYIHNNIKECQNYLLDEMEKNNDPKTQSKILWMISRNLVDIGDKETEKASKFKIYDKGIEYANKSLKISPNPEAHLWRCSNIGRWAQTKGIFDSLGKAGPMRDELYIIIDDFKELNSTETWYVLATLYGSLPGGFISFGNNQFSISYYRKAVDTIPNSVIYPNHYKALAKKLYDRNWNKNKRASEFSKINSKWNSSKKNSEKYAYYEGKEKGNNIPYYSSVNLNSMSDRQEAVMLLSYAINKYKAWPYHTIPATEGYNEVVELYKKWT